MKGSATLTNVENLIGHSAIYEEQKGDFRLAGRSAMQMWESARHGSEQASQFDALFARGMVYLLQGEASAAIDVFETASRLTLVDTGRQIRSAEYRYLAEQLQRNTMPDGGSAGGVEIAARWDVIAWVANEDRHRADRDAWLERSGDRILQLECKLLQLLGVLLVPRGARLTPSDTNRQVMTAFVQMVQHFRASAEALGGPPQLLAFADLAIADLCHRAGEEDQARQFVAQAESAYLSVGDVTGAASCRMAQGDWIVAPNSSPLVWNRFLREGLLSSELDFMSEEREFVPPSAEKIATARRLYAEAEHLFSQAGAPRGLGNMHLRHAFLAASESNYEDSGKFAAAAGQTLADAGDIRAAWVAQVHLVLSQIGLGQRLDDTGIAGGVGEWGKTSGSFTLALGLGLLFAREGRRWHIASGDYERSLACFRQAATLFERLEAASNWATTLYDQGTVYQAAGDFPAALQLYARSLEVALSRVDAAPAIRRPAWLRAAWATIALIGVHLAERNGRGLERAATEARRVLSVAPQPAPTAVDTQDDAMIQTIGRVLEEQARTAAFFGPLYRAVEHEQEGDDTAAQQGFEQALSTARAANEPDRYLWSGTVLAHLRRFPEAAEDLRRYFDARQTANATTPSAQAATLELFRARDESNIRKLALAAFIRVRAYPDAARYLADLEQTSGPEWWRGEERPWEALADIGELCESLGDLPRAADAYGRGIQLLEERRALLSRDDLKTALLGARPPQWLYFQAARTALAQYEASVRDADQDSTRDHARTVFAIMEAARARALTDLVAAGTTSARKASNAPDDLLQAWFQMTAKVQAWRQALARDREDQAAQARPNIAELEQRLVTDELRLNELSEELARTRPAFYGAVNPQATPASLTEVIRLLPEGTVLLEYSFLGDDLLGVAVTRDGVAQAHHAAVDARQVARRISAFHLACQSRRDDTEAGSYLAGVFLEPFSDRLAGAEHVVVVPFGAAHLLPFHALPWHGNPFAAAHCVSYLPSAGVLAFLRHEARPGARGPMLAIGGPARMSHRMPGGSSIPLSALPGAALQARLVAERFPGSEVLLGEHATEQDVVQRLPRFPLVHLATHGVLDEAAPLLSAIAFAEGEELTVYELMGMRLHADLVVLSACQTGQGRAAAGEDVLGLTRAVLAAGARRAVVSLWRVDEMSTTILMDRFYALLNEGSDAAQSLRMAQRELRTFTAAQVMDWCATARNRLDLTDMPEAERRLMRTTANAHFVAREFDVALESYTQLLDGLDSASPEYRELRIAVSRCQAALRHPQPPLPAAPMYALPYYWAPFVLVGDWQN